MADSMYDDIPELNGTQKAAILMISLGPEYCALVYKYLTDDDIEKLTLQIANMKQVSPEVTKAVITEFYQMAMAKSYLASGGLQYAQDVLEKALGSDKASVILARLTSSLQVRPFDFLHKTDPAQLLNFIQNEHPQTIALIMAYLEPDQAAIVLSSLPQDRRAEVTKRIATMDRTSPDVLREVERVLERKLSSLVTQDFTAAGGVKSVVEVLNRVDMSTQKDILENLEVDDPELAEDIKKLMFVFDDIVMIDDRGIQKLLGEVDQKDLILSLKAAQTDVAEKVYKNMSKKRMETVKEELQYMGPVKIKDVEEAQQRIVNVVRALEEKGDIVISRGGGEEMLV